MKRLLDWFRNWICSDLEERHGVLIGKLEQRISEQDAVLMQLNSDLNTLSGKLNELPAPIPANRRVARTFSEFRAAAEGRP